MKIELEVIAVNVRDAAAAEAGGADRIELVAHIEQGGTTPCAGIIKSVKKAVRIPVFVMINPPGARSPFAPYELEAMETDAKIARDMGADGIVTGVRTKDGTIDEEALLRILEAAKLPATFHRAIDRVPDIDEGVRRLAGLPYVERVLTSGGRESVLDGLDVIARLVKHSPLAIMPGGGVTMERTQEILRRTGARAIHVGTAAREPLRPDAPVSEERVRALRILIDEVARERAHTSTAQGGA